MVNAPEQYAWSSYGTYLDLGENPVWLERMEQR